LGIFDCRKSGLVCSQDFSTHYKHGECDIISVYSIATPHMEQNILPVEVIISHPRQSLGSIRLDWTPQPGNYIDLEGQTYAVLERHHRYQLKSGRYQLQKIALYVQSAAPPTERTFVSGIWVVGDASCHFNYQPGSPSVYSEGMNLSAKRSTPNELPQG
jgi:hypothetical protein